MPGSVNSGISADVGLPSKKLHWLAYQTVKMVKIDDPCLGCLHYSLSAAIFAYIVVVQVVMNTGYILFEVRPASAFVRAWFASRLLTLPTLACLAAADWVCAHVPARYAARVLGCAW